MHFIKNTCVFLGSFGVFSSIGFAFDGAPSKNFLTDEFKIIKQGHVFMQLGRYWSHQGAQQRINIVDLIGDKFTVSKNGGNNGLVGLGYLVNGQNYKDSLKFVSCINAFYLAKTNVAGNVMQENLFTNLSYSYQITHWPVYMVAKSIISSHKLLQHKITLDLGIGPNFMQLTNFKEKSLSDNTLPDKIFINHASTTFSATIGAGLKLDESLSKIPLECGYRFYYLGKGNLAINNSQVRNSLNTGYAYANALMCTMTT